MAKTLVFKQGEQTFAFEPVKLDRKKLYGWSEKVALDPEGRACVAASLYPEFSLIIPKGGTALGALDARGNWAERDAIRHVYEDGSDATLVPSSFDAPIALEGTVTPETFLEHNVTSIYVLQSEAVDPAFLDILKSETDIYTFEFNYRTDYEGDPAFILHNDHGIFLIIGKKIEFEFVGLDDEGTLESDEDENEEADDEFDFSMM